MKFTDAALFFFPAFCNNSGLRVVTQLCSGPSKRLPAPKTGGLYKTRCQQGGKVL